MGTYFRRVALLGCLGSAVVAVACASGGGILPGLGLDGGDGPERDATVGDSSGGLGGLLDAGRPVDGGLLVDGGQLVDANHLDASDALAALDGTDGSDAGQCQGGAAYPDAATGAAAFSLDNAYGAGGVTRMNFGVPGSTYGAGMARQADGKLLLGIRVGWNRYTVGVARFLTTGAIDTSFGTNGVAFVPLGKNAKLEGVLLQSTGKVVLVGQSDFLANSSSKGWLARFDASGAIDTSFGTTGMITFDAAFGAATLQPDDSILVTAYRSGASSPTVGRFQPNGVLDSTFGNGGWAPSTGLAQKGDVVFLQADGRILIGVNFPRAMSRLTSSGALDTTFGTAGAIVDVRNDAGAANAIEGFAQQADGKILAAGRQLDALGVQRLSVNGAADPTFGDGGWGTYPSEAGPIQGAATAAAVQADGKILSAGDLGSFNHGVGRFNVDGGVDTTYGTAGFAQAPFNTFGQLTAMVTVPDAGVALGGDQLNYVTNIWVAGISMLGPTGALNASFGDAGLATLAAGASHDEALGLAIQPDGRAIVVGTVAPDRAYSVGGVARLGTAGALDTSFAGTGMTTVTGMVAPLGVVVESTGRIVVGSQSDFGSSSNQNGFIMKAFSSNGVTDTAFGSDGGVASAPGFNGRSIALGPSDRIAAVGEARGSSSSSGTGFLVSLFSADGRPSAGWGDGGAGSAAVVVTTPPKTFADAGSAGASAAVVQSDGKIVAAGYAGENLALARYTTTGALDTTFGTAGVVTTDTGADTWIAASFRIVIQPNGAFVVAGIRQNYGSGSQTSDLVLVRYDASGRLDCTFAAGGVATVALGTIEGTFYSQPLPVGLALAQDGRIYVTTTTTADGIKEDVLLLRFTTSGFVDAQSIVRLGPGLDLGHAVAVQSDGKVVIAGRTWTQAGLEDFYIARFSPPP